MKNVPTKSQSSPISDNFENLFSTMLAPKSNFCEFVRCPFLSSFVASLLVDFRHRFDRILESFHGPELFCTVVFADAAKHEKGNYFERNVGPPFLHPGCYLFDVVV